ncbi:hypothetical protein [Streptomyces neyagawaensis]|uniref:hypothetical protein n=1 Tax=Streptomyces neyagawaensis TaxID=42238 RepID=UPI00201CEABA|nr:hypothetical protein [Streptomyces neyagawaensis]MCL6737923.1 hypothetical protein [Streptomyces neyagawaensis]MDE1687754.1 hypothetical protein [Streptomyces neyagawaensis]
MPGKRVRRRETEGSDGPDRPDGPDVETVLDELYVTPPSDFVGRREVWAAAARTSGRGDDARAIRGARRPTLAAWAANLLLRSRPEESRQFLQLGESLREAYRTLDPGGLKELSDQRRRVVAALSREAAGLARTAGQPLSGPVLQEVESTLRAVLADADAARRWSGGRLETALAPPSTFSSDTEASAVAPATAKRPTRATAKPSAPAKGKRSGPAEAPAASTRGREGKDELAERRRERQLRLEREQRLTQAREAAEAAERRLDDRRAEAEDADASLRRTRDHRDRARRQVSAAEQQLRKAREALERAQEQVSRAEGQVGRAEGQAGHAEEDLDRAEQEQRQAEERRRTATAALTEAEREARDAARAVHRLSRSHGD